MLSANFKPGRTAAASRGFFAAARLSYYLSQRCLQFARRPSLDSPLDKNYASS